MRHPTAEELIEYPGLGRRAWVALVVGGWAAYGLLYAAFWGVLRGLESGLWPTLWFALGQAAFWCAATWPIVLVTRSCAPSRVGAVGSLLAHALLFTAVVAGVTLVRVALIDHVLGARRGSPLSIAVYYLDHHVLCYLVVVGITVAVDGYRVARDRALRTIRLETRLSRAQLQYLQRQLQPHFLFNCLNAVSELIHEAPESARQMLRHLRALLGNAFDHADRDEVTVADELEALQPYLEIQRARFGDALTVRFDVAERAHGALIPNFVVQPLVENAIRHGLESRAGHGMVHVEITIAGNVLRLAVADNGRGVAGGETRSGVGLRNTVGRLRQLYGDSGRFSLENRATGGAIAQLEIPLRFPVAAAPAAGSDTGPIPSWTPGTMAPGLWQRISEHTAFQALLVWVVFATLWTWQVHAVGLLRGAAPLSPFQSGRADILAAALWVPFAIPLFWWARMVPVTRRRWIKPLLIHGLSAITVAFLHYEAITAVGILTPRPLLSAASFSPLFTNVLLYSALMVALHVKGYSERYREREVEAARLQARIAQARWQAVRVELRPDFVLGTIDLIAALVGADSARAERLTGRLAEMLRLTLDTAGRATTSLREELALLSAYGDVLRLSGRAAEFELAVPPEAMERAVPSRPWRELVDAMLGTDGPVLVRVRRHGRDALDIESSIGGRHRIELGAAPAGDMVRMESQEPAVAGATAGMQA